MSVLASDRGALPKIVGNAGLVLNPQATVEQGAGALRSLLAVHGDASAAARRQGLGHAAATPLIIAQLLGLPAGHAAR